MIMNFLVMPLYFLSGAMFPLDSVPAWMQTLMVLDPLTYGVDALRHVVLSGVELPTASVRLAGLVRLGHDDGRVDPGPGWLCCCWRSRRSSLTRSSRLFFDVSSTMLKS